MALPEDQTEEIDAIFRPVWQCDQGGLDLIRCLPAPSRNKDPIAFEGSLEKTAKNNLALLDKAFSALTDAANKRSPFRLMVPVNSVCLINDGPAAALVNIAKRLPPILRKAIIFEVFNFPTNLTLSYLDDATIPLMPFFDNFIAAAPLNMKDFTVFTNCNYFAASINFEEPEITPENVQDVMDKFCTKADRTRLKVFVHGVGTKSNLEMIRAFVVEGFDGSCYGEDFKDLSKKIEVNDFN